MRHSIPTWYYLMTPAFVVLDYAAGINIRIAALDTKPVYKALYYGFCVACGLVVFLRPRASIVVAIVESSVIILITAASLLLPMLVVTVRDIGSDWSLVEAFDLKVAVNLVIAGTIAILALRKNVKALTGRDVLQDL